MSDLPDHADRGGRATRRPPRRSVGWSLVGALGELLVTLGVVVLLFVAWELWWTDIEANRAADKTTSSLTESFTAPAEAAGAVPDAKAPGGLIEGRAFGLMYVPRFGGDWVRPIFEGTDLGTLSEGLGHYNNTVGPGAVGNFAVAGHRTTWGRPFHTIETLVEGDTIVVETRTGYDVYAVASHEIVLPSRTEVIAPVPNQPGTEPTEAWLTLTACHPKFSARERYIVHAKLTRTYTREEGLPTEVLAAPTQAAPAPAVPSPAAAAPDSPLAALGSTIVHGG
jgi:sortase A